MKKIPVFLFLILLLAIVCDGCKTVDNSEDLDKNDSIIKNRFTTKCVKKECVVHDKTSALYWQRDYKKFSEFKIHIMKHEDSVKYCSKLKYGGFDDWRLPTIKEAKTRLWGENVLKKYAGYCNEENVSSNQSFLERCYSKQGKGEGENGLYIAPGIWSSDIRGKALWTSTLSKKPEEHIFIDYSIGTMWAVENTTFLGVLCVRKDTRR